MGLSTVGPATVGPAAVDLSALRLSAVGLSAVGLSALGLSALGLSALGLSALGLAALGRAAVRGPGARRVLVGSEVLLSSTNRTLRQTGGARQQCTGMSRGLSTGGGRALPGVLPGVHGGFCDSGHRRGRGVR
jgi:hypothetical protein